MLENLNQVILNLEKSLKMLVADKEAELLSHPEYLQAMKEVVQSINQVTRTLKNLEQSCGRETEAQADKKPEANAEPGAGSRDRVLKVVKKKTEKRNASSN